MKYPHILTNFDLTIDAMDYAGVVEEITLPVIKEKKTEIKTGRSLSVIKVPTGKIEPLEAKITLNEQNPVIYAVIGAGQGVFIAKGTEVSQSGTQRNIIATMVGPCETPDFEPWKHGEISKLNMTIDVQKYTLLIDGLPVVFIDILAGIMRIGGFDRSSGTPKLI